MSIINTAVQDVLDGFPWISCEQTRAIEEKYGKDVMKEIDEILHYTWETAFQKDLSVVEFGKRCRDIAKKQYPFLEKTTVGLLVSTLEYAFWK